MQFTWKDVNEWKEARNIFNTLTYKAHDKSGLIWYLLPFFLCFDQTTFLVFIMPFFLVWSVARILFQPSLTVKTQYQRIHWSFFLYSASNSIRFSPPEVNAKVRVKTVKRMPIHDLGSCYSKTVTLVEKFVPYLW